jgi:hypothetical protein
MTTANRAWFDRAGELADWTLARLINRRDAWGSYRPECEVGREYTKADGTKGALGSQKTVKGNLPRHLLVRHFRALDRADILGAHAADKDNLGKWGGIDIDWHGPTSTAPAVNLHAALWWYSQLARLGFHPLLTESNGQGGYHLRALLAEQIPADRIWHFLRMLTADYRRLDFPLPPEQFPKQADVRRCKKGLGNWLRLPGRHHKRDYWSRVWDGGQWLAGHAAIDFILALTGDRPELVPLAPTATPPKQQLPFRKRTPGGALSARIAAYMNRLPHGGVGSHRDDRAFTFASFLVRDLNLSDTVALDWLERWDAGNNPPKGTDRLREIIKNAHAYGERPYGCGLPTEPPTDRHGHRILRATAEIY